MSELRAGEWGMGYYIREPDGDDKSPLSVVLVGAS
jgi:hypothetical protein